MLRRRLECAQQRAACEIVHEIMACAKAARVYTRRAYMLSEDAPVHMALFAAADAAGYFFSMLAF